MELEQFALASPFRWPESSTPANRAATIRHRLAPRHLIFLADEMRAAGDVAVMLSLRWRRREIRRNDNLDAGLLVEVAAKRIEADVAHRRCGFDRVEAQPPVQERRHAKGERRCSAHCDIQTVAAQTPMTIAMSARTKASQARRRRSAHLLSDSTKRVGGRRCGHWLTSFGTGA